MEKLITKSFERLMAKGVQRGFITHEELQRSLGKRHSNLESVEKAFLHIFDKKISLDVKKTDYQTTKKKEAENQPADKTQDKSDDPIRMYLREMGGSNFYQEKAKLLLQKELRPEKM